jgi:hypothetical protein
MSDTEQHEPLEHIKEGDALTMADLPPDFGNPAVVDFPDPAWDETDDQEGETPDLEEPEDSADDAPDEDDESDVPPEVEDEEPVVPPGVTEEQLEDPDEPDDYDPKE